MTTGGTISLKLEHPDARTWRMTVDPKGRTRPLIVHLPAVPAASATVDGKPVEALPELSVLATGKPTVIELRTR